MEFKKEEFLGLQKSVEIGKKLLIVSNKKIYNFYLLFLLPEQKMRYKERQYNVKTIYIHSY